MKESTRQFVLGTFFSLYVILVVWYWGQYLPCLVGAVAGGLRIYLFQVSKERDRFQQHSGFSIPALKRSEAQQHELRQEYAGYKADVKKLEVWRKPLGFLALALVAAAIVLLDKQMIFYTFIITMMTVWVWFQGYLAWKVGE
ncbi:hypothetical protein AUK40_00490 [Candidatus Wirthbacteria bacterium CG2_30_54_11]|uniref:Uncharacterized protein n=1 Tax=Candidatus Wirthbacteria bacterium CG2_30_54_11 TaxID=1817892 RepID=A0A1J5J887_9BACT|nr:MAG: hypothetical protein AUK40_00490 [Candidatus Wirthbacteria bacterium CG2_30_54_11]